MAELRLSGACAVLKGRRVFEDVSLTVGPSSFAALLGPNGAGKTSLLRASLGLLPLSAGEALIGGRPVGGLAPLARARLSAYLPQHRPLAWPMPVRSIVALGRYAYGAGPGRLGREDEEAVARALGACDLEALADRPGLDLSGGEAARMHLARALAAETGRPMRCCARIFWRRPTASGSRWSGLGTRSA